MKKVRHYVLAPSQEAGLQHCIHCGIVVAAWPKFFQPGHIIIYDGIHKFPEDIPDPEIPSCSTPIKIIE